MRDLSKKKKSSKVSISLFLYDSIIIIIINNIEWHNEVRYYAVVLQTSKLEIGEALGVSQAIESRYRRLVKERCALYTISKTQKLFGMGRPDLRSIFDEVANICFVSTNQVR